MPLWTVENSLELGKNYDRLTAWTRKILLIQICQLWIVLDHVKYDFFEEIKQFKI